MEIVSPSNDPEEIREKVAEYLAAGSTYRTILSPRRVERDGMLNGEDVLPGFSLPVVELLEP